MIALNAAAGFLTARSKTMEKILDAEAVLLGRDGTIFGSACKKHRLLQGDIEQALREADCELKDLRCAFLVVDGSVSIQKTENRKQKAKNENSFSFLPFFDNRFETTRACFAEIAVLRRKCRTPVWAFS